MVLKTQNGGKYLEIYPYIYPTLDTYLHVTFIPKSMYQMSFLENKQTKAGILQITFI